MLGGLGSVVASRGPEEFNCVMFNGVSVSQHHDSVEGLGFSMVNGEPASQHHELG